MQDDLHEVPLQDMLKTYLNGGGQPTDEDLDSFTYDACEVINVAREADLRAKIVSAT